MSVTGSAILDEVLLRLARLEDEVERLRRQQGRIKHAFDLTSPPSGSAYSSDEGFQKGSLAVVNDTDAYICVDAGTPTWKKISP